MSYLYADLALTDQSVQHAVEGLLLYLAIAFGGNRLLVAPESDSIQSLDET